MDKAIMSMLEEYQCITDIDYENALKEIMQQIALLGLWRAKFFEHAAFYGGTALRILYQIDRFSEDLDFSLLTYKADFKLEPYLNTIAAELAAFGFETSISMKKKIVDTAIQSAFLKANTQQHLIQIEAPQAILDNYHGRKQLKIKLEIDTEPPAGFETEEIPIFRPIPFWVKSYTLPCLFAGKIGAVLCRQWKSRVKGRDWYDFLWFIQRATPVNLEHLEIRLRSYGYYQDLKPLTEMTLKAMLAEKINSIDLTLAKEDIIKFVKDPRAIEAWSLSLFQAAIAKMDVA